MSPFPLTIRFTRKFPPYGGNHEGIRFIDILDHPRSFELDDDDSYDDVINLFKAKEVYRDGDGWNIRVRFVVSTIIITQVARCRSFYSFHVRIRRGM